MGVPEELTDAARKPWADCSNPTPIADIAAVREMMKAKGYARPLTSQEVSIPAASVWLRGHGWTREGDDPTRGWGHPEMPGVRVDMAVAVAAQREVNCRAAGGQ